MRIEVLNSPDSLEPPQEVEIERELELLIHAPDDYLAAFLEAKRKGYDIDPPPR